jgi:hypothetical protein
LASAGSQTFAAYKSTAARQDQARSCCVVVMSCRLRLSHAIQICAQSTWRTVIAPMREALARQFYQTSVGPFTANNKHSPLGNESDPLRFKLACRSKM